jgi:hypothetical protein
MKSFVTCVKALALAVGTFSLMSPVNAQGLELRVGPNGVGIHDPDRDRDGDWSDRRRSRGCNPDDALDNARDAGFRRAHVVRISPRSVVVEGMTRRGPDRITFANVRGCPEV